MVLEDYWKTENDVESSALACYAAMTSVDGYKACYFLERIIASGEVRSDNIVEGGSDPGDNMRNILKVTIDPDNGLAKWDVFYKIINHCNLILKYAPEVAKIDPNYSEGKLHVHEAEALALRALTYFYLVRIYKDVPYVRVPYVDDSEKFTLPKTDGAIILEDMVNDLILAEEYAVLTRGWNGWRYGNGTLTFNGNEDTRGRISKNAIRALLADIYLWQASGLKDNPALQSQKYENCVAACERIEPYVLEIFKVENIENMLGAECMLQGNDPDESSVPYFLFQEQTSTEIIFELSFSIRNSTKTITELYGHDSRAGNLSAAAKEDWVTEQDLRKKYSYAPEKSSRHKILKYTLDIGMGGVTEMPADPPLISESAYPHWIFYRLADVYLMKAEALAELGGETNLRAALDLVNKIYLRSNPKLPPLRFDVYKDKMRWLVLEEREREFLFEGKRWFDLIRLWRREGPSTSVINLMTRKYKGDTEIIRRKLSIEGALYMPIHKDELINNYELEQNTFYKTTIK
jgi:hypothetical protein